MGKNIKKVKSKNFEDSQRVNLMDSSDDESMIQPEKILVGGPED